MASAGIVRDIYRKLGGAEIFDRELATDTDLARVVHAGLSVRVLDFTKLTRPEIFSLIIPERTLRHRRQRDQRLSQEETGRLVRLTRIQAIAEEVFEDADKAGRWLRQPLNILDDRAPLDYAATEPGARVIEQLLAKIAWGAAA